MATRVLEVEDLLDDDGVYLRWESKSDRMEDAFTGVFDESDATLEAFVGDVGEGGVDKIFTEDGDLGEDDANSCVSFEGLVGTINCGRSAIGRFGIWSASACSYNQNQTKCLSDLVWGVPRPNVGASTGGLVVSFHHRQSSVRRTPCHYPYPCPGPFLPLYRYHMLEFVISKVWKSGS